MRKRGSYLSRYDLVLSIDKPFLSESKVKVAGVQAKTGLPPWVVAMRNHWQKLESLSLTAWGDDDESLSDPPKIAVEVSQN